MSRNVAYARIVVPVSVVPLIADVCVEVPLRQTRSFVLRPVVDITSFL